MRWKQFVKLATDHPYFDERRHLLSESAAEAILSSGYMGYGEFMESVRQRICEIDDGLRRPIDPGTVLPNEARPAHRPIVAYRNSRSLRNIAIACMAAVLLTAFLAFTSPGRAIAQAIYRAIVSVIDGKLSGKQTVPENEFGEIDLDNLPAEFSSVEEAREWIPLPVAIIESEQYKSQGIKVLSADDTHIALKAIYVDESGTGITLVQRIYAPEISWGNSATADERGVKRIDLSNGLTAYVGIMGDGSSFAMIYLPEGNIRITSISLSIDELAAILENLGVE